CRFFCQAEDGIRGFHVTGVQTCALPILFLGVVVAFAVGSFLPPLAIVYSQPAHIWGLLGSAFMIVLIGVADDIWDLDWLTKLARSEERRVGNGCPCSGSRARHVSRRASD